MTSPGVMASWYVDNWYLAMLDYNKAKIIITLSLHFVLPIIMAENFTSHNYDLSHNLSFFKAAC